MSANALKSQGMKLEIGSGASPTTYTKIPERKAINGPTGSATVIDTTDLDSVAKEKRLGLKDEGQISFNIHYIPKNVTHAALKAAYDSGNLTPFRLTFTDSPATQWYTNGYVNGFSISNDVDGVTMAAVTIELTGQIIEV